MGAVLGCTVSGSSPGAAPPRSVKRLLYLSRPSFFLYKMSGSCQLSQFRIQSYLGSSTRFLALLFCKADFDLSICNAKYNVLTAFLSLFMASFTKPR